MVASATTSKTTGDDIKTMKLYTHLDRIDKELEESGFLSSTAAARPLTASQLSRFDSMHYLGDEAVREAMQSANILNTTTTTTPLATSVLDIGSGLGGPARLLSEWSGCRVDALELQADLNERARQLTQRCGSDLSRRVRHFCGDFLSSDCGRDPRRKGVRSDCVVLGVFAHFQTTDSVSELLEAPQARWTHVRGRLCSFG